LTFFLSPIKRVLEDLATPHISHENVAGISPANTEPLRGGRIAWDEVDADRELRSLDFSQETWNHEVAHRQIKHDIAARTFMVRSTTIFPALA
jgi:hypothetical protein